MIDKIKEKLGYIVTAVVFVLSFAVYMLLGRLRRAESEINIQKGEKEISDAKQELSSASHAASDAESEYKRVRDKYRQDNL